MPFTKPVVVIDNGSYNIKAGFACDNHPVSIFRNVVGRPKYLNGTYGKGPYEVYIGDDAVARSDILDLNHPVKCGRIYHWDNMERIWHHIFYRELKAAPEDRAVMLSCAPTTTIKDKVKCCEIFFETLNAPALCVKPQSVLALYGSGCTTGVSVDLGQDGTEINPVYEGGSLNYANMRTNFAGFEIDNYIKKSFDKRGLHFSSSQLHDIISAIKRHYIYITENCAVPLKGYERKYKLPSGEEIDVGDEAFMCGEMYFQPELVLGKQANHIPLQEAIVTSVIKCDAELQNDLYDNVVTHGGMSSMRGLNRRLGQELEDVIHRPVNVIDSTESSVVSWLGGSVFAGTVDARKVWVHKKLFEDQGERVVRNRF